MSNGTSTQGEAPHDSHGNSAAAWTGVAIIALASVLAGIGVLIGNWWLFFIAAIAGTLLGVIVWKMMGDADRKRHAGSTGVVTSAQPAAD